MPQDAFTLRHIARELDKSLRGGKLSRIVQPLREEIALYIYTGKRTVKLVLNANASDCGAYFSETERENPLVAPNFCMLLRKHLQNAEILSVSLVGFERILAFRLCCNGDFSTRERVLYAEIMGKYSNLVLTEEGIILGAMKTTSLDAQTKRMILPGAKYVLPAPQEKADPRALPALAGALENAEGGLSRALFLRVAGLAPFTAEQIAASFCGGDLAAYVHERIFSDDIFPCADETDFYALQKAGATPFPSLMEAQSAFYAQKRAFKERENARRTLLSALAAALKKQEKNLARIAQKRAECDGCELLRLKGELITANLYRLTKGLQGFEAENYYDEEGGTLKIALDPYLTPAQNAQAYYKRYRKQKRTLEILGPQAEEAEREADYLKSLIAAVQTAAERDDLVSLGEELLAAGLLKQPKEPPRKNRAEIPFRTFESGGFRIYAGRNNLQNDRLIRSSAPDDIWLHAQKVHSCHVVIKTEGRAVPADVLQFAADICARYSDGKGDRIPVDYCKIKSVKKPPKAKAGFVIYSDCRTLLSSRK